MVAGYQPFSLQDGAAYPYAAGVPGALVDVVGIRSIQQAMTVENIENRGDGAIMAQATDLTGVDLTITTGAFAPASIAAISGGTVTTSGTGPTTIIKLDRKTTDTVAYFKLAGQTRAKDAEGGAARVTYNKVAWMGGPDFAFTDNEFPEYTINARAIPDAANSVFIYEAYATWTALA